MGLPSRAAALARLASESFDLLVVGGGITGCCIARDAARRGLSVALVDRHDFSSGTSAATSRLIHGGLRYLKNLEVSVVRESLRERRIWGVIAPHAVAPAPFILPTLGSLNGAWMRLALMAYDALSWDRNRGVVHTARIPRSRHLDRNTVLQRAPVLERPDVTAGLVYHDTISESPERLAIACLTDAAAHGAVCVNYMSATGRTGTGSVDLVDGAGGATIRVSPQVTILAAGPWTDLVARQLGAPSPPRVMRSKGIHLVTRALTKDVALLVPVGGRHFFVIPWHGRSLVGTTDEPFLGDPDDVGVSEEDIAAFLRVINTGLPRAALTRDDVAWAYAGLRPLAASNGNTYAASRRSEVTQLDARMFSVIGGKWTTSRAVAEQCVDRVERLLGRSLPSCTTASAPLPWSPAAIPGDATSDTNAIARALNEEMATSLADIVLRRTHLAVLTAHLPTATRAQHLSAWADAASTVAGWSAEERDRQVEAVIAACRRVSMWPA
ncbi:MAG: glycerol-3-phosphate dehydrogenase/oxidase [Gemmatimonadetes bacterium]|nr:glycerol-3-phosphate dehydrogenase/oxidase [Gemmatimonadota bacterium]